MIGHGKRHDVELEQIPDVFYPVAGKNQTRGEYSAMSYSIYALVSFNLFSDLHKIYYDDESHNKGHGRAYEFLGIDPKQGAMIIVRPDQCELPIPNSISHLSLSK